MIPEHEAQAMRERSAYLVDRVNLDRLARQVMSLEEAAAFVVLVEAHAADLARLLEERETLREVLPGWEETIHYAVGFLEWVRNTDEPEMKALLDGYCEPETGLTFDEWGELAENGLNRIKLDIRSRLSVANDPASPEEARDDA